MMKLLISFFIIVILTACATTPVPIDQLSPVPAKRLTWKNSSNPTSGTLIITRDPGLLGSQARVMISIDGAPAGQIKPGEIMRLKVNPGNTAVVVNSYYGLFGGLIDSHSFQVEIKPSGEEDIHLGFKK